MQFPSVATAFPIICRCRAANLNFISAFLTIRRCRSHYLILCFHLFSCRPKFHPYISHYSSLQFPLCLLYSHFYIPTISIIFAIFPILAPAFPIISFLIFNPYTSHQLPLLFPLFVAEELRT